MCLIPGLRSSLLRRQEAKRMASTSAETEWRCTCCGALLGIERGSSVELKYKQTTYLVERGLVTTRCRRCGTGSRLDQTARSKEAQPPTG